MMIIAELFAEQGRLTGFHISGHSGYDEEGKDIICAFVSSAAYMAANTMTDIIGVKARTDVSDGNMLVRVSSKDAERCKDILEGLKLHLMNTEEQYPEFLQVIFTEV